jgi:hypothetical protein
MSEENVDVVELAVAALNDRDVDGYLACCTDDVEVETPTSPIEGVYKREDGVRRYFSNILDAGPDLRVAIERLQPIGSDRVIGFMRLSASGRDSGLRIGDELRSANLYELAGGKIKRVRIFLDRKEALQAAGLSE